MSYWEGRWHQYCPIGGRLKFFTRGTPKNAKNAFFCFRANYSRFWCCTTYPEYHHVKADVLRIPKMYKIRWFRGFEHELWLLKVGRLQNFESVTKNTDVTSTAMREVRESQGSSSGTWTLEPWTMNHEPTDYSEILDSWFVNSKSEINFTILI